MGHGCYLESQIIEYPLTMVSIILGLWFFWQKKYIKLSLIRAIISVVGGLCITLIYFAILHSTSFPRCLLSKEAIEHEEQMKEMKTMLYRKTLEREKKNN